jgi:uncharacterized membrane protein YciS (DUF1049 family)
VIGLITLGALLGVVVLAVSLGLVKYNHSSPADFKYAIDSATFGLTLVQILLAIVAIGLAALAVVGYKEIRLSAQRIARDEARRTTEATVRKILEENERMKKERTLGLDATANTVPTSVVSTPVTGGL